MSHVPYLENRKWSRREIQKKSNLFDVTSSDLLDVASSEATELKIVTSESGRRVGGTLVRTCYLKFQPLKSLFPGRLTGFAVSPITIIWSRRRKRSLKTKN